MGARKWLCSCLTAARAEDGTAVLELALLLPVYVLLSFAILYLGYTGLILQEGVELAHYASMHGDDQSEDVDEFFYDSGYEGDCELSDNTETGDVFDGENHTSGNDEFDIHDILVELSYTFWGGFTLKGGKLVYETDGGKNWRGERIDRFLMMEENDVTAWMLNDWVHRSDAEVTYVYSPYFIPAVNQEDLLTKEIDENKEWIDLTIKTQGACMIRGDKERPLGEDLSGENIYELTDQFSTGSGNRLPGYSDFGDSKTHWTRK